MKYTPGEWKIRKKGITSQIYVATPERLRAKEYLVCEGIYLKSNAHLISAAPAMYEALKAYQKANRIHNDSESSLFEMADVAFTQAEGKEVTP